MTGRLVLMLTGLVRGLAGLLGERRRDWVQALLAEIDDLPSPSARLAWLSGGLWFAMREVVMTRIIQALAFAAGAVGLVWIGWPGASTNSATPVNRMYVVGTLVLLVGVPLLVRRYAGPIRPGWAPRTVRVAGYAAVLALIAAMAVQERIGSQLGVYFPVIWPVWAMHVGFLLILAGYVAGLFILTSSRCRFTRRVLPTRIAARDPRPGILPAARQALLATAGAMATAAILVALFTTLTIALLPHHFAVRQGPDGDGICPTCEPSTIVIPANLRHEYSFEAGVSGAGDGEIALLIVPLIGAAVGALRGHLLNPPPAGRPDGFAEGA